MTIRIPDSDGNEFRIIDKKKIVLKLKTERKARNVGIINSLSQLVVKRKRKLHLHYMSNSYGFNYFIIANAQKFQKVLLCDELGRYLIPNSVILEEGKFLYFKQTGFEKQLFLPLDIINKFKL